MTVIVDIPDTSAAIALCGGPHGTFAPVVAAMQVTGPPQAFACAFEQGIRTTCAAIPPPLERTVAGRYTRANPAAVLLFPGAR